MVHDMFLLQVKSQKESTEPWDYFKVVTRIAGDDGRSPSWPTPSARWSRSDAEAGDTA